MGKLGKLQRSKKNKKIKTVEKSFFDSCDSSRDQFNLKPSELNDQPVPRSVREIMHLKEKAKVTKKKKRRRKNNNNEMREPEESIVRGMSRPMKPVPKFERGKRESEKQFMNRVNRTVNAVIQKAQFEEKFDVDLDETKGKVEITKKKKEKTDHQKERAKMKTEKRKAKKLKKEAKKSSGFERLTDEVRFGEVAQAPPQLSSKPRKTDTKTSKPGQKSLLLKDMMHKNREPSLKKHESVREVGKTMKRKHMSFAQQRIMDGEREKAILQYRQHKLNQLSAKS